MQVGLSPTRLGIPFCSLIMSSCSGQGPALPLCLSTFFGLYFLPTCYYGTRLMPKKKMTDLRENSRNAISSPTGITPITPIRSYEQQIKTPKR